MANNKLGILVGGFVLILLGLIFINPISNIIHERTSLFPVVNETITVLNGTAVALVNDDVINGSLTITNQTDNINLENFTIDYDAGTIMLLYGGENLIYNSTYNNTNMNISYSYEPADYVSHAASRTILNLITIFFAIGIVGMGILYIRNMGGTLFK